jgi:hypothetical protein
VRLPPKQVTGVILTALYIFGNALEAIAGSPVLNNLPLTFQSALDDVRDGVLDSTTWSRLRQYYAQPLNVPTGELRYLIEQFPELTDCAPIDEKILAVFEPWTPATVDSFFKDYPELIPLRPILSFQTNERTHFAHLRFFANGRFDTTPLQQSARFKLAAPKYLGTDGTLDYSGQYARWQKRSLRVSIPHVGAVTAGNFLYTDRGFLFGRFQTKSATETGIHDNWRYGDASTWNGIAYSGAFGNVALDAIAHKGLQESIIAANTGIRSRTGVSLALGASRILSSETTAPATTILGGLLFEKNGWYGEIRSGIDPDNPRTSPVAGTFKRRQGLSSLAWEVMYFPRGRQMPFSSTRHSAIAALGISDTFTTALTGHDIRFSVPGPAAWFSRQTLQVRYWSSDNNSAVDAVETISGTVPITYSLSLGYTSRGMHKPAAYRVRIAGQNALNAICTLDTDISYTIQTNGSRKIRITAENRIAVFHATSLMPYAAMTLSNTGSYNSFFGLKQRLFLFEKTFGEIDCSFPLTRFTTGKIRVYAQTSFLL